MYSTIDNSLYKKKKKIILGVIHIMANNFGLRAFPKMKIDYM